MTRETTGHCAHLTQALHRNLQQGPDCVATVFGGRSRTVAEQADRVSRLAGSLRARRIGPGDRLAFLALNSDRNLEAILAAWWLGAVVTPLNTRWSLLENIYALNDSGSSALFVDDNFGALVPELLAACPHIHLVVHTGDGQPSSGALRYEELVAENSPVSDARVGGDAPAGIFYTGGTTGTPKGVVVSHQGLIVSAIGSQATFRSMIPGGRLLLAAPLFHLAGLSAWIGQSIASGSHLVLPGFEPGACLDAIEAGGVTTALLVPTMIQMMVDDPSVDGRHMDSLQVVLYGASPISSALLRRAMKAFPSAGFVQAYGMTELSPVATILTPVDHADESVVRSAGRAAVHSEVMVADDDGVELPRGRVGEVLVRGPHVMLGYWNKPEETEKALRGGLMHTGDAGYMDKRGFLFIVDRVKDMIISGGENVYSTEVENAVAQHPAVAACAVIGVPDERWGERVHAVVVLKTGHQTTAEEISRHARSLIASYKAPRSVEFVDALPVSAAGKVLKRELRDRYWAGAERGVS